MAKSGRPIRHLVKRVLKQYPIVKRSGGKTFIVDYYHPTVASAIDATHRAALQAAVSGGDYVTAAAKHISEPAVLTTAQEADIFNKPSDRNRRLYKMRGNRVYLSEVIKHNALTPSEQSVLFARALQKQGMGATVVSGESRPGHKLVFVRLGDGRFVDPGNGEVIDKNSALLKTIKWVEVHKA
jgi:hypothetical protein